MTSTRLPAPAGCKLCGIGHRGHGRQYTEPVGWHTWQQPTQQQIKERMLARRAERNQMSETRIRADILFEAVDLPKVEFDKLKARIGEIADEYKATVTINGRMYPAEPEPFVPDAHYLRDDGVECCVHTIPVGPDSCRACRELADE